MMKGKCYIIPQIIIDHKSLNRVQNSMFFWRISFYDIIIYGLMSVLSDNQGCIIKKKAKRRL